MYFTAFTIINLQSIFVSLVLLNRTLWKTSSIAEEAFLYKIKIYSRTHCFKLLVYGWIMQASFPGHVGGARKSPENEATAVDL